MHFWKTLPHSVQQRAATLWALRRATKKLVMRVNFILTVFGGGGGGGGVDEEQRSVLCELFVMMDGWMEDRECLQRDTLAFLYDYQLDELAVIDKHTTS
jgi:hypothetical protein